MHRFIVAVTGTPGTGKSHFAKGLSRNGTMVIEINDIVHSKRIFSGTDKFNTKIVKLGELTDSVKRVIKKNKETNIVLVGHLAPELRIRYDVAVCIRADLPLIAKRMEKRRYAKEKIRENLVSEAMDYCGLRIRDRCKEVYEVETNKEKRAIKIYLEKILAGRRARKPKMYGINKFGGLLKMIKSGNRYGL